MGEKYALLCPSFISTPSHYHIRDRASWKHVLCFSLCSFMRFYATLDKGVYPIDLAIGQEKKRKVNSLKMPLFIVVSLFPTGTYWQAKPNLRNTNILRFIFLITLLILYLEFF